MTTVKAAKPMQNRFEQGLDTCDAFCRSLKLRLRGLKVERIEPDGTPPTWSGIGEDGAPVVSFGLVDTIFFWTFDEGVSNHYSRDPELMTRTIAGELSRAGHLSH